MSESIHDEVVKAIQKKYAENFIEALINTGSEKNVSCKGLYPDVVVPGKSKVIEVETSDTVSDSEASTQWVNYAETFDSWHLVVPLGEKDAAKKLLAGQGIKNCTVSSWFCTKPATIQLSLGLPGLTS